jgi:hypothetical protein
MAIEKDLKRIADALEALVAQGNAVAGLKAAVVEPPKPAPSAVINSAPAPVTPTLAPAAAPATMSPPTPAPPVAAAPPAAAPAAPIPMAAKTDIEMNDILIVEFKRLGTADPINNLLSSMGLTGVTGLTADVQQKLITAAQALQP